MTSLSETSLLAGASGQSTGYTIDQSIRFDVGASPEMSRTHGTGGNTDLFTVSFWFKRGRMTTQVTNDEMHIFGSGGDTNNTFDIQFTKTDQIHVWDYHSGYVTRLKTDRKFRDPSAWYHLVFVYDSGNGVASDRARLYINGVRETSFEEETYPSQNQNSIVGTNVTIGFGNYISYGSKYLCGYLAEMHYVNGYGYGPENFGEFKEDTDIWIPKEFEGSYGSKGFFVDGRDSGDLGDDESGNGNDLSTSGLATHDQVLDSPTNNFAVLNPVDTFSKLSGPISNGNLQLKDSGQNAYQYGRATFGFDVTDSAGWYWELYDVVDGSAIGGVTEYNAVLPSGSSLAFTGARGMNSLSTSTHHKLENTTYNSTTLGVTSNAGDIVQFCVKNGKLFIGINGTYVLSGNPATEANPLFTGLTGTFMPFGGLYSGNSYDSIFNFGQDGTFGGNKTAQGNTDANGFGNFFYAPPTGAKALCSRSLGA